MEKLERNKMKWNKTEQINWNKREQNGTTWNETQPNGTKRSKVEQNVGELNKTAENRPNRNKQKDTRTKWKDTKRKQTKEKRKENGTKLFIFYYRWPISSLPAITRFWSANLFGWWLSYPAFFLIYLKQNSKFVFL